MWSPECPLYPGWTPSVYYSEVLGWFVFSSHILRVYDQWCGVMLHTHVPTVTYPRPSVTDTQSLPPSRTVEDNHGPVRTDLRRNIPTDSQFHLSLLNPSPNHPDGTAPGPLAPAPPGGRERERGPRPRWTSLLERWSDVRSVRDGIRL